MELVNNLQIGSDVEFFVARQSDGQIVSAEGFIPGTKKKPASFGKDKWFATQLDNVLAEGNIPPFMLADSFVSHIRTLRDRFDELLSPHGLMIVAQAAAVIPKEYLITENAKAFGCDESYNCWTLAPEPVRPHDSIRTAGFHIHIGYNNPSEEVNVAIARALDVTLGLAAATLEPPSKRRELGYGLAGNFRHQKWGVEYRTLSSFWASEPWMLYFIHDAASTRLSQLMHSNNVIKTQMYLRSAADEIQGTINTGTTSNATDLLVKISQEIGINIPRPHPWQANHSYYSPYRRPTPPPVNAKTKAKLPSGVYAQVAV